MNRQSNIYIIGHKLLN